MQLLTGGKETKERAIAVKETTLSNYGSVCVSHLMKGGLEEGEGAFL
jgi:hypothetical protein